MRRWTSEQVLSFLTELRLDTRDIKRAKDGRFGDTAGIHHKKVKPGKPAERKKATDSEKARAGLRAAVASFKADPSPENRAAVKKASDSFAHALKAEVPQASAAPAPKAEPKTETTPTKTPKVEKPKPAAKPKEDKAKAKAEAKADKERDEKLKNESAHLSEGEKALKAESLQIKERETLADGITGAEKLTVTDANGTERVGIWKNEASEQRIADNEELGGALRPDRAAGSYYQREGAAAEFDALLGGPRVVPDTVVRDIDGERGSFQTFVDGARTSSDFYFMEAYPFGPNAEKGETLAREIARTPEARKQFALDLITGNDDRHGENTLFKNNDKGVPIPHAIDNGLAFSETPVRFLFATEHAAFADEMLSKPVAISKDVDLPQLAGTLHKYDGITEKQITATLSRAQALKNDPELLVKTRPPKREGEAPQTQEIDHVMDFLSRTPQDRVRAGEISANELKAIKKMARRPKVRK